MRNNDLIALMFVMLAIFSNGRYLIRCWLRGRTPDWLGVILLAAFLLFCALFTSSWSPVLW